MQRLATTLNSIAIVALSIAVLALVWDSYQHKQEHPQPQVCAFYDT